MPLRSPLGKAASLAFPASTAMAQAAPLEHRIKLAVGQVCPDRALPTEMLKIRTGAGVQLAAPYNGGRLAQANLEITERAN